jgi:small GTP-binding protein
MSEVNQNPISCKTILVGESGVGKTSIIGRYLNKFNENQKATIGASFSNKLENIDGKEILFEIWDTAGQERYRSVNTLFYQDAYICILVYDIKK